MLTAANEIFDAYSEPRTIFQRAADRLGASKWARRTARAWAALRGIEDEYYG
jgi:hypothetical protein